MSNLRKYCVLWTRTHFYLSILLGDAENIRAWHKETSGTPFQLMNWVSSTYKSALLGRFVNCDWHLNFPAKNVTSCAPKRLVGMATKTVPLRMICSSIVCLGFVNNCQQLELHFFLKLLRERVVFAFQQKKLVKQRNVVDCIYFYRTVRTLLLNPRSLHLSHWAAKHDVSTKWIQTFVFCKTN